MPLVKVRHDKAGPQNEILESKGLKLTDNTADRVSTS